MKKLHTLILCFALLVLAACSDNLFGSSSSGTSNCGKDIKCLRIDAENLFRDGNFKKSYERCDEILQIDSTVSFGYFGKAKASLWDRGINPLGLFYLAKPSGVDECPFTRDTTKTTMKEHNNLFQAMKAVYNALSELDRRDTLTALYERYKKGDVDVLDTTMTKFIETFCGGSGFQNCRDTTDKREPFPLSDREYKSSYFRSVLLLATFSKGILNLYDTDTNSCLTLNGSVRKSGIDFPDSNNIKEWKDWGCSRGKSNDLPVALKCQKDTLTGEMKVIIDSKQVLNDLQGELVLYYDCVEKFGGKDRNCVEFIPSGINDINGKIDGFGNDFNDVEGVLNNLGLGGSGNPDDEGSSLKNDLDKYKAYASFYKVGTHIDEDGDGCIDEELLDGLDNDGDGLANENARLASIDTNDLRLYGVNIINNSMRGTDPYKNSENVKYNKPLYGHYTDFRVCNAQSPNNSACPHPIPDSTGMATVLAFTQEQGYWTTTNMLLKLAVAQDTACGELKYPLEQRKLAIGGCWSNYDECKFVKYWLRRELANDPGRVHSTCVGYKLIECPPDK